MVIAELAAQGGLRPVIDRRFAFEEIVDAYRLVDSGERKEASFCRWILGRGLGAGLRG